ncbi:SulP family inorganic anion transporter [Planctomyces sp. SH-PL14]|uniref:SulP family inorganic anion transporter n=1 Tax=Planctomyces sp. SH-PL14 TaxID=1632864 RepID=UPI00078C5861|nr:SulP family inorganic anion transporter [Planctomyces sp. SH-PL14]AMV18659.1 C4-dicarboxylic acid transporter DauA [Planctomyces sp. SH-PL14]
MATNVVTTSADEIPRGDLAGFKKYLGKDLLSGFLVFLIALPLCIGISLASGAPAQAGIFTAIIGSIVTSLISNSELTIKGPAAGLIVIVFGAVSQLQHDFNTDAYGAYRLMLAVGVAAGVIQIGFGLLRSGILGEFFPTTVVHGMLAAIGLIIISSRFHVMLGLKAPSPNPLLNFAAFPSSIRDMNPEIALIGLLSLAVLIFFAMAKNKTLKRVPAQMVVLILAIPLGMYFSLGEDHTYTLADHQYTILSKDSVVNLPDSIFRSMLSKDGGLLPDFRALQTFNGWKWVLMFSLIASLESLLSAKAIDLLDPWKRKSNMNRDLFACGIANTAAAMVGGLPMISEIVRSKANIDNGARTRFADMWHGVFLLAFVALFPGLIHRIPNAALAAMLVFTGYRLASPKEFIHLWNIGREQLIIFVATIIGVLATDLLMGIGIGIATKFVIHMMNGVSPWDLFKTYLDVQEEPDGTCLVTARESAVFSNWIPFKRQLEQIGLVQRNNIVLDLSNTKLVDTTFIEKLHGLQSDFTAEGLSLKITGLDSHRTNTGHAFATRRRGLIPLRRITVTADTDLEETLVELFVSRGATGYTVIPCHGAGKSELNVGLPAVPQIRFEVVVMPELAEQVVEVLREQILPKAGVTVVVETVEVIRFGAFVSEQGVPSQPAHH